MTLESEAALIDTLALGVIGSFGAAAILLLLGVEAPYGRYTAGASGAWGFKVPGKVAWVVQEAPNVAAVAVCARIGNPRLTYSTPNLVLLGLFGSHYIIRTFVFPLLIRGGKPTTLVPFLCATAFCSVNGYIQARSLTYTTVYPDNWVTDPRFIIGVLLWGVGFYINQQADDILRNLRKPGDTGYHIPKGGMFEYVSAANYFGEVVEWTGFAIAAWSLPAASFALATLFNLGPRALQHHRWYKAKFKEDYPVDRRAFIPYVL